ncbi:MAG: 50S ribosomal protein L1 [Rickettsiales bacterium]|jgi:large subunit ribosomal protein L1|nr:50S ribosomal protein L1 [Rickettsiales bacterium]
MAKITKKAKSMAALDKNKTYALADAIDALRKHVSGKFDETLDIAVRLGVDITKADQSIRGMLSLPNGTGRIVRVAVFTKDKQDEAKKAGADIVGDADLIDKVAKGFLDFDRVLATPEMMPAMAKIAKVLGPKGMMPNPKLGTVAANIGDAVAKSRAGQIEYRAEKAGIIHAGIGKISFSTDKLVENANALLDALKKAKPASVKGQYILGVSVSTTQGAGLKVENK